MKVSNSAGYAEKRVKFATLSYDGSTSFSVFAKKKKKVFEITLSLKLPVHRYYRPFGESAQCERGYVWGRRRFEDDGDYFLCVGGDRCNLHWAAGSEEEKEGAEAQEAER